MKKTRGFTLIELLVVIAIIGILAGIVLVSLNQARIQANNAKMNELMLQYANAIELARDQSGNLPTFAVNETTACLGVGQVGAQCGECLGPGNQCGGAQESDNGTIKLKNILSQSLPSFPLVSTRAFRSHIESPTDEQYYWYGPYMLANYPISAGDYTQYTGHLITWLLEGTNQTCARLPGAIFYDYQANYHGDGQATLCRYAILK